MVLSATVINVARGVAGPFVALYARSHESFSYLRAMKQGDLFNADPKLGVSSEEAAPVVVCADLEKVRAKLYRLLDEMRAASALPWGERELRYWRTVVPQMSRWLPEAEGAQLRHAFEAEVKRLDA